MSTFGTSPSRLNASRRAVGRSEDDEEAVDPIEGAFDFLARLRRHGDRRLAARTAAPRSARPPRPPTELPIPMRSAAAPDPPPPGHALHIADGECQDAHFAVKNPWPAAASPTTIERDRLGGGGLPCPRIVSATP